MKIIVRGGIIRNEADILIIIIQKTSCHHRLTSVDDMAQQDADARPDENQRRCVGIMIIVCNADQRSFFGFIVDKIRVEIMPVLQSLP